MYHMDIRNHLPRKTSNFGDALDAGAAQPPAVGDTEGSSAVDTTLSDGGQPSDKAHDEETPKRPRKESKPLETPSSTLIGSQAATRLIAAQRQAFPDILKGMNKEGPGKWRKRSHWAWYAFPTTLEGASDFKRTAVENARDAQFVLANAEVRDMWTAVLGGITRAVVTQSTRKVLPAIDHGRVQYFLADWRDKYPDVTSAYPEFHKTLHEFAAAWEDA